VKVSIASQIMTVRMEPGLEGSADVQRAVEALGYRLTPIPKEPAEGSHFTDDEAHVGAHITRSYQWALWAVAGLNLGYGAIEGMAGIFGKSQALQADALDFLGDGSSTLVALLATLWSVIWRARSALLQGVFLAVLGIGVLVTTAVRIASAEAPDYEVMGAFGVIALAVNVAAALVLLPHRAGDSSVRAVWLFSRNDAIGNAAVVVAAGLVGWTGSNWPDLVVASAIAVLFLQSAWTIVRDARDDLRMAAVKA